MIDALTEIRNSPKVSPFNEWLDCRSAGSGAALGGGFGCGAPQAHGALGSAHALLKCAESFLCFRAFHQALEFLCFGGEGCLDSWRGMASQ